MIILRFLQWQKRINSFHYEFRTKHRWPVHIRWTQIWIYHCQASFEIVIKPYHTLSSLQLKESSISLSKIIRRYIRVHFWICNEFIIETGSKWVFMDHFTTHFNSYLCGWKLKCSLFSFAFIKTYDWYDLSPIIRLFGNKWVLWPIHVRKMLIATFSIYSIRLRGHKECNNKRNTVRHSCKGWLNHLYIMPMNSLYILNSWSYSNIDQIISNIKRNK